MNQGKAPPAADEGAPQASHLYIDRVYKEVASAPSQHVAEVLIRSNIRVHTKYLL